jgi:hypothetical protein
MIGIVLLLLGSEALGFCFGEWNYRLFQQTVPPVALSQFNQSAAHVAYSLAGVVLGLAIFVFALIAVALSRFFGGRKPAAVPAAGARA